MSSEEKTKKIQVRCIGCQAIGYVPVEGWADRPCPKCGRCLTDWVKTPYFHATKKVAKAHDGFNRKYEDLHKDLAEMRGDGTEYTGAGKAQRLEDRDDFKEFNL